MLRSKNGERLVRRIEVKIFFPKDTVKNQHAVWKSGPKQGYGPDGIDDILMQVADRLDQLYPWWDFKMVPVASSGRVAQYNFSVVGFRAMPQPAVIEAPANLESIQPKTKESSASEYEATESNSQEADALITRDAA